MLRRKVLSSVGLLAAVAVVVLTLPAALWGQGQYLDELIVRVKPEKVTQFESIARKIADANRHANGDRWLAMVSVYGESNTYVFVSRRDSYADIDKGADVFMTAINKAMGKVASQKLMDDFNSCVESSRAELRVRRPDLSGKMVNDPQALNEMVGKARVLRVITLRARPGHEPEFEAMLKDVNAHADANPNAQPVSVSEGIEGGRGSVYYVTFFRTSLGGFDNNPQLPDLMGEEGMAKVEKTIAEVGAGSETAIYRFAPELSNPPDEIAQVSSDYWQPKAMTAAAPQHKAKAAKGTEAKPKEATKD
jgi:quinol monooxygenase YgiN